MPGSPTGKLDLVLPDDLADVPPASNLDAGATGALGAPPTGVLDTAGAGQWGQTPPTSNLDAGATGVLGGVPSTGKLDAELPAWMNEPAAAEAAAPPAEARSAEGVSAAEAPPPAMPAISALPAWMTQMSAASEEATAAAPVPAEPAAPAPEAAAPFAEAAAEAPASVPAAPPAAEPAPPPEAAPPVPAPPPPLPAPAPGTATSSSFLSAEDLPAWLRAISNQPAAAEAPPAPAPVEAPGDEVPAWLRALSSVDTDLTPAMPVAVPAAAPVATARVIRARPPRPGAVDVFHQLLAAPPAVPAVRPARRAAAAGVWPERIVYLILLVAVIGMWAFTPLPPETTTVAPTAEGTAFYQTLQGLPAGAPVLLAYDWDAGRYGEMHPLSLAVTRALVAGGHPLVTMSTVPEGAGFALQVTAEAVPTMTSAVDCGAVRNSFPQPWPGPYGTQYLHLGYVPGNEAGLARLAGGSFADLEAYDLVCSNALNRAPIIAAAPTLQQFGAVVVLAGGELSLRLWVEQVARQVAIPVLVAAPQSLRPLAQPYLALTGSNARLRGGLFGVAGAQDLEQRLSGGVPSADLGRLMHAESAGLFVVALALIVGFAVALWRRFQRRRVS